MKYVRMSLTVIALLIVGVLAAILLQGMRSPGRHPHAV